MGPTHGNWKLFLPDFFGFLPKTFWFFSDFLIFFSDFFIFFYLTFWFLDPRFYRKGPMVSCLCVRACVRPAISRELEHRFFLIFCMELGDHNWRKVTNLDFSGKIWFSQNLGKCGEKCDFWWFFAFYEKSNHGLGIQTMFKQKI